MSETFEATATDYIKPLHDAADLVPEIAHNADLIAAEGSRLIDEYGVETSFFEEPADTILLAALAKRSAGARPENGGSDADRAFVDAASKMLFVGRSRRKKEFAHELGEDGALTDEQIKPIYDRLTNRQVTDELREAFNDGLLADVRGRLGVNETTEQPFVLRVLNIGHASSFNGLEPSVSDPSWQDFSKWRDQLIANYDEFMRLTAAVGTPPAAQVMNMDDGSKTMLIPLPVAEKILHPEMIDKEQYPASQQQGDMSKIKHEYVHTQRSVVHSYAGLGIEERRADYLANANGYMDVFWLGQDLQAITGVSLNRLFDDQKGGTRQTELYMGLANTLGLDTTLDLALVSPTAYSAPERGAQTLAAEYIGGYDGILRRLYQKMHDDPDQAAQLDERLNVYAQKFAGAFGHGDNLERNFRLRSNSYGLKFVTDLLAERIKDLPE